MSPLSINETPPPVVEFDMDLHDPRHFMERLYDISQQLGYQFPGALLDKLDLPDSVRVRCALDTATGQVTIVSTERA